MEDYTLNQADILAECLDLLENGRDSLATIRQKFPEQNRELNELLLLTATLRQVGPVAPRPEFRQDARQRLVQKLPNRHALVVTPAPWYRRLLSGQMVRWATGLAILLIAFLFAGGVAQAADRSVPGDILYPLDRSIERARVALTRDPAGAVRLQLALAAERTEEAGVVAGTAPAALVDDLLVSYGQAVERAFTLAAESGDALTEAQLSALVEVTVPALDQSLLAAVVPADEEPEAVTCTGVDPHPAAVRFAGALEAEIDDVSRLFCQGFGFGEIKHLYDLSARYGEEIDTIVALRTEGNGWGQIKKLLAAGGSDDPPPAAAPPTSTVDAGAPPGSTPGPVLTLPPTNTPGGGPPFNTGRPAIPGSSDRPGRPTGGTATPNSDITCAGDKAHPSGTRLSTKHGVPYEEILGWYCAGFTFSSIDQAYLLGAEFAREVDEILTMRLAGKGWGVIRRELQEKGRGNQGNAGGNNGNNGQNRGNAGNEEGRGNQGGNSGENQGNQGGNSGGGQGNGQGNGNPGGNSGSGGDQGNSGGAKKSP